MSKLIDLTGQQINEWTVLSYAGDGKWTCKCSCGVIKEVNGHALRNKTTHSCGHDRKNKCIDLTGETIGEWYVRKYVGNQMFECECSCGNIKNVNAQSLRLKKSLSCGHNTTGFRDITGQTFGEITVLKYKGNYMYECECFCGKVYLVDGRSLRTGHTTSCGHATNAKKDILGQQINDWYILEYVDRYKGMTKVRAQCKCGRIKILNGRMIRLGLTKSCGQCNRTDEQIEITSNKEKFITTIEEKIKELDRKLTLQDLMQLTGLRSSSCKVLIRKYNAQHYIEHNGRRSKFEVEICNYIKSLNFKPITSDRTVICPKELDIYLPEHKLAIECNGVYWHSSEKKSKNYHAEKSRLCAEQGISLIHIFDYE